MSAEPKRILVADDEPDVLLYLCTALRDNGFETLAAKDGNEVLALARSARPDLITLDMTMPEKSGVRAYRELKDDPELKDIPVLIITGIGQSMKDFLDRRRQVPNPEGFLSKPVKAKDLLENVHKLLKV